mgnify:CR=1 FL=1
MLKKLLVLTIICMSLGFGQWTEVVVETMGKLNQIQVLDDGLAYVALGGTGYSGVLKTTDYGTTWDTLMYYAGEGASSLLTTLVSDLLLDPSVTWWSLWMVEKPGPPV